MVTWFFLHRLCTKEALREFGNTLIASTRPAHIVLKWMRVDMRHHGASYVMSQSAVFAEVRFQAATSSLLEQPPMRLCAFETGSVGEHLGVVAKEIQQRVARQIDCACVQADK